MTGRTKTKETCEQSTMQERMSEVGSRIDNLIAKASETKTNMSTKLKGATNNSAEALDALKQSMDAAWQDVNQAWEEVRVGTEKAAQKLQSQPKECAVEKKPAKKKA